MDIYAKTRLKNVSHIEALYSYAILLVVDKYCYRFLYIGLALLCCRNPMNREVAKLSNVEVGAAQ